MRYAILYSAFVAGASAHGLIRSIEGANGVTMPGLSVADGTPRNCVANSCGAQADTAIIRDLDISTGQATPLGKTQGNGPVDPAAVISTFMGNGKAPTNKGAAGSVGVEDNFGGLGGLVGAAQRRDEHKRQIDNLFGGFTNLPFIGAAGLGGAKNSYPVETIVSDTAGQGTAHGLPTCDDQGVVSVVYRQVRKLTPVWSCLAARADISHPQINQDGAGPLTAAIDPSSGGYDANAFQGAQVTQNMPGLGIGGLSLATNTDFLVKVQMPEGMTCDGKVGGAENVCIVRVRNSALAGPFGGAAAFTQSPAARKRAIAYRLRKRFDFSRLDSE
ncbi:Uncharacterized protein TPAR_06841 [Tolypocladium paradoxum]|uniref:Cell surface protein (Mas1) n=1 Tax=Tolypocladium paradoxum TaxID=94208 RepID=A0A2S4KRW1_9HYPO|nr:Uncharacterized protein TPAR_06841 [Tolypocladium paradoxum]